MNVKSCFSSQMDPYRAGIEIGEALVELKPEIIFIFPTSHYGDSTDIAEAIYDVLESDQIIIFGNTGDGFYEYEKVSGVGIAALGINSNHTLKWHTAMASDIRDKPFISTKICLEKLQACIDSSILNFIAISNYRIDTPEVMSALEQFSSVPVVGGIAGADINNEGGFLYLNRHVYTDSLAIVSVEGPLNYDIQIAHTLQSVGKPGKITESEGSHVFAINDIPAMSFLEQNLGKRISDPDQGQIMLRLTDAFEGRESRIRSIGLNREVEGANYIDLYGGFENGNFVQVCLAPSEKLIQDVSKLREKSGELSFEPIAALVVSCSGRKSILVNDIGLEVTEILRQYPTLEALAGYPSYGEFAPVKQGEGYSKCLFHNMTHVLLLIGDSDK